MSEQDIRVQMVPQWRAVQAKFIEMCGGDMHVMAAREHQRREMEAPLIAEYHRRVASEVQP
jgi:hypothetical protein